MRLKQPVVHDQAEFKRHHFRLSLYVALLISGALFLVLRLGYLQFYQYKRFATLSLKNQMSITPLPPPRGLIFDKNGVVLADNIPVFVLEIIPERVKQLAQTLAKIQKLLPSITEDDIANFEHIRKQNHAYVPIPLKLKLTEEEVATFASHQHQFPGITIKAELMRYYPLADMTAHIVGYVGRINLSELKKIDDREYRTTHFIGKSGLERYYENMLHGHIGYQQVETDVSGRTIRVINSKPPLSGQRLTLTLDTRLQKIAYDALNGKAGAVVVMSTHNGDILAMASAPSFDPNVFVKGINAHDYQQLTQSGNKPLYNRAITGTYPPASPVKPFISLAGLESGAITPEYKIYDPGWYRLPRVSHVYRDWNRRGHGFVNLKRAITVSCDTYFYQLGNKIGINAIEDILKQFGFGRLSHVDLAEEAAGLVPNPQWKRQMKHLPWYPGDTLITAIGQGFMLATPLQLANATASISQHGRRFRPHLVASVADEHGVSIPFKKVEEYPIQLKHDEYWDWIIEAMRAVITDNNGTGYRFGRNAPYTVAGKTGTAQVFSLSQDDKKRNQHIPDALRDHSLFIAFAPVEKPEVALAVIVEHDTSASLVARQVMDGYFHLQSQENTQ